MIFVALLFAYIALATKVTVLALNLFKQLVCQWIAFGIVAWSVICNFYYFTKRLFGCK